MSLIHVLGIGSPFGDDRLGWEVIDNLLKEPAICSIPADILQVDKSDRPGIRLLELMKPAKIVFLVDAISTGGEVGTIHCLRNHEIENVNNLLSSHDIGIVQALMIGKSLNEVPELIILYGIEIDPAQIAKNISTSISASIEKSIKIAVKNIQRDILQIVGNC